MSDNTDERLEDFDEHVAGNGLRVISTPERKPPPPDPEFKALLDDLLHQRERAVDETGDTHVAA